MKTKTQATKELIDSGFLKCCAMQILRSITLLQHLHLFCIQMYLKYNIRKNLIK